MVKEIFTVYWLNYVALKTAQLYSYGQYGILIILICNLSRNIRKKMWSTLIWHLPLSKIQQFLIIYKLKQIFGVTLELAHLPDITITSRNRRIYYPRDSRRVVAARALLWSQALWSMSVFQVCWAFRGDEATEGRVGARAAGDALAASVCVRARDWLSAPASRHRNVFQHVALRNG